MDWQDQISVDPKVLVGKPVIKGTRIAVEFLMELLAEGWTHDQILKNFPHLPPDDIQAALHYAVEALKQEHVHPLPVLPPGEGIRQSAGGWADAGDEIDAWLDEMQRGRQQDRPELS